MTGASGSRIGPYEIHSPLGEGGMGVVYRARDTKLQRDVALKLLSDHFARDPDRLARFEREAHVLASLNHPNIAQIYGLEDSTDRLCIVMELVEGETLAERLRRGPMPLDEALRAAKQVTEALEAAHERGVMHRDLKPANIKVTPDGNIKVLDFGLAKPFDERARADASNSPTLVTAGPSQANVILGTAAYMSPEQARGQAADARSDIFAFGCVLYEMLAGKQAFTGETVTDILARIVTLDPDWRQLPPGIPSEIRTLLRRCLQKDRNRRLHHMADARIEIESALGAPVAEASAIETVPSPARRNRERLAWAVAGVSVVLLILVALFPLRAPREEAPELRLDVTTPPTSDSVSLAISPDGRRVAFVALAEGKSMLFVRDLDSTAARPLPSTDGATYPFWSPDGRSLGFFADGKLKRLDVAGGVPQMLASAPTPRGGSWNTTGTIVFGPTVGSLYRVPAAGGKASVLMKVEPPLSSHRFPHFLPDGQHFLFYAQGNPSVSGVYVGALDGSSPKRLVSADGAAVYHTTGFLLFTRQGTLFGQSFDLSNFAVHGDPIRVADKVVFESAIFAVPLATAANGAIAYRAGSGSATRRVVWFDRFGKELGALGSPNPVAPNSPELSPDERHVALYGTVNENVDVWTIETTRSAATPFTSDPAIDLYPVWSQDGKWIAFGSTRNGPYDLFRKLASGAGTEELFLNSPLSKLPADWSSDGRFILYRETHPENGYDLWAVPTSGDKKPIPVATTSNEERDGQFSRDVRWVAYSSNVSGRSEIYVQPFPGPGGKVPVSTVGGAQPRWRHDGKEIFYIAADNSLMSVPLKFSASGDSVEPDTPVLLFRTRIFSNVTGGKQQYAVSRDGQRFLAIVPPEDAAVSPITVLLNWKPPKQK